MAIYYRSILKRETINRWGRIGYREYLEIVQTEDISKFNYRKKIKFRLYVENERIFIDEEKQTYFENCLKLVKNDEIYSFSLSWKNGAGIAGLISDKILTELSDITISINHLTTYIPIPSSNISKFLNELTIKIKEEFENLINLETTIIYVSVVRKLSRVMTFLDFEYRTYPNLVAEVTLELPRVAWDLIFTVTEEIKDFFQENLC